MPRIDPQKLLTCLCVLLAPNGGIRSEEEVKRLAGLMDKFSKKLVSKCIYIQICKCTETELLGQFMAAGGWSLTHNWLTDGILTKNWPLVRELLELLLLCPVDVARLKSNSAPKLVKQLSKEGSHEGVRILATKLVEQWLKIVKGETLGANTTDTMPNGLQADVSSTALPTNSVINYNSKSLDKTVLINNKTTVSKTLIPQNNQNTMYVDQSSVDETANILENEMDIDSFSKSSSDIKSNTETLVYKITVKNGKQHLQKVDQPKLNNQSNKLVVSAHNNNNMFNSQSDIEDDLKDVKNALSDLNNKDIDVKNNKKVSNSNNNVVKNKDTTDKDRMKEKEKEREKSKEQRIRDDKDNKNRDRDRERDRKSSSSSHKSSSKSSSSSRSHSSSKSSSSSSKSSNSSSSISKSSSSSSRDKDRHKSSSSSSSAKSSSSSNRDKSKDKDKEKEKDKVSQAQKDKDTLAKILPPSIDKLGKIPKKVKEELSSTTSAVSTDQTSSASQVKKTSISIEVRKDIENRPKTVKTFNSQFRSHGLAEEAPPPPPRKGLKKPTSVLTPGTSIPPTTNLPKRSVSPPLTIKDINTPPEKKIKLDSPVIEKPGSIKLIPPKPKPLLVESDMFMDALSASATNKKDTKKRKRRTSSSKDGSLSSPPDSPISSPKVNSAPLKFYQDTMDVDESKEENKENKDRKENVDDDKREDSEGRNEDDIDDDEDEDDDEIKMKKKKFNSFDDGDSKDGQDEETVEENEMNDEEQLPKPPGPGCGPNGPPGVLTLHRRKGPKKQLKWREKDALEEIRYFELDETERVNVTKTFIDAKQSERCRERELVQTSRKFPIHDKMYNEIEWRPLVMVDCVPPHPEGAQSKERKIQSDREQTVLKVLYFSIHSVPDTASEPDVEQYQISDPQIIPLDDITGNPDAVNDLSNMPWPESRGSPPHSSSSSSSSGNIPQFTPPFNPFGQNMGPNTWQQPPPMNGFGMPIGPMSMPDEININMNNNMPPPFVQNDYGPSGNMPVPPFGFPNFQPSMNMQNMGGMNMNDMGGGSGGPPHRGGPPNNGNWFRPNGPNWMNNNHGGGNNNDGNRGNRFNNGPRSWGGHGGGNRMNRFGYNSGMRNRVNQGQ